jgi:bifunctional non-homologous end joining protein LigD
MSLKEYRRKRAFEKTPEPPPGTPEHGGNTFVVQRHSARRLHYDLRLEMDGVLKSWAVPKGPTLDPNEKRLAVLVEDHPLEYGNFEGTIPEGNYGAGSVTIWDRGTYEWLGEKSPAEQWERGDLKFQLHGEKLVGEFALVRMKNRGKGNEWLLIKKKDFAAQPGWDAEAQEHSVSRGSTDPKSVPGAHEAPMPKQITPMLATPSDSLPESSDWLYEIKWDGVRSLAYIQKGTLKLVSRKGHVMDSQYPDLARIPELLQAETAILDGEIVAFDEQGRPSFAHLQPRIMATAKNASQFARSQPVTFFVFDLLYLDGCDLRQAALIERKRLLAALVKPSPLIRVSDHFLGNGPALMDVARQNGLEGVIAKRTLSRYVSKRSNDWLKVKVVDQQEFVMCAYIEGERKPFGSLAVGYFENEQLQYAGNVGSGLTDEIVNALYAKLRPLETARSPFVDEPEIVGVHWVKPELVCTVRFSSWTKDRRLRAPVFLGLRLDVAAEDCVRESPVAASEGSDSEHVARRAKLLRDDQNESWLTIDGRRLKFTNLDKVFYPKEVYKKRDVINYYDAVADLILPHLAGRPLSLKRYPNGIEGDYFFQKDAPPSFPSWLRIEPIFSEHNQAPINFVVADDRASLLYLANLGCIDQNPWMSRVGSLENPDFILIDLDPVHCAFDRIVEAAQLVRRKLELLGLVGCPKTTGGDGMHVYIPVEPRYTYDQTRTFAEILARLLANERPDLFTTPRAVAHREKGKVYFDALQNSSGKTIAAPYVLRAYPGAPVSTPLRWNEVVRGISPTQFNLANVLDRFARVGDLFEPLLKKLQRLEPALEKLERLVRAAAQSR